MVALTKPYPREIPERIARTSRGDVICRLTEWIISLGITGICDNTLAMLVLRMAGTTTVICYDNPNTDSICI